MNISESPEEVSPLAAENAPLNTWTDEETGDDEPGEEGFRDENMSFSNAEDEFTEFDSSTSCDEMEADVAADSSKKSYAERARIFKLRRNLDQLDSFYKQKEHDVLKAREELKACRGSIVELEKQRGEVERDIEQQREADNTAAVFRLRSRHRRLCAELLAEEELESHIAQELRAHELELCQVEVERGRFSPLRQEVEQEEQVLEAERARRAARRLEQEDAVARRVRLRRQRERRKQRDLVKEQEERRRQAAEEARASHLRASVYFKETMSRIRQKEAEKELQSREMMERRMQAVLSLKSSITATQEKLRAKQARDRAYPLKQEEEEEEEMPAAEEQQAQNRNITRRKHRQKQPQGSQKKKELFVEQQKSKKVETISRVSLEETLHEKLKKTRSLLFPPTPPSLKKTSGLDASAENLRQSLDAERAPAKPQRLRPDWRTPSPMSDEDSRSSDDGGSAVFHPGSAHPAGNLRSEDEEEREEEECLALPEFTGLWDLKHRDYKDLQDDEVSICTTVHDGLALAQANQQRALLRNKAALGKEFRGCPFVSKPEFIHFKDFDVGKTYKKKITLTNVTYSTNYCKLLGVTELLKDFISIHFEPPGPMSPGMACDMMATFKPMINKDLDGEVQFLSAAGPFSVPLRCTIKKCSLSIDCGLIDFGTHVVGETISRTITLTNQGAVGTYFILVPSAHSEPELPVSEPVSREAQVTPQDQSDPGAVLDERGSAVQQEGGESKTEERAPKLSAAIECSSTERKQSAAGGSSVRCPTPDDPEATGPDGSSRSASSEQIGAELRESGREDSLDCCDIRAGEGREGEIGPFGCVKLHIVFTPTVLGEAKMDFHIRFSDPDCQPIPIAVRGMGVCVPVWVAEPNIDLKICMYDRLYQDSIVVQSRSNTALRLTFEVRKELRNHMEVLPKTGYVQARSSFNAQLKFLPRFSLPEDAEGFFDRETGVLEVPMSVQVADQVRPVAFTVNAILTTSELEFDRTEVDFGHCSVFESVKTSVLLRNRSLLPQDFGFLGIPEFVDVQPNDGFGTLLPLETLEIDVIFSPKQATEYKFQLNCKSGINRDFKLRCSGVGVHPPLELSHSLVQFGATAAGDVSTAVLHVVNAHTGHGDLARPPPRVGKGPASPAGPRLFQFAVPESSEISIAPTTGRVLPGQRCLVQVTFRPTVCDEAVREEAVRLLCQAEELRVREQEKAQKEKELEDLNKKDEPRDSKRGKNQSSRRSSAKPALKEKGSKPSPTPKISSPFRPPHPADIRPDSDEFAAGKASLLLSFAQRFTRYVIPCFVSNGDATDQQLPSDLLFSPHNTLYLELHCPAVRPAIAVISNKGRRTVNFHQVAVGQRVIQKVTIQNTSQESLELRSSLLDLSGPFMVLNALRPLGPQATHSIVLSFCPTSGKKYRETLDIKSAETTLRLTLCGAGVDPAVTCSHEGKVLDFGYALERESASRVFKLQNASSLQVRFRVHLDSLSLARQREQEELPAFLACGSRLQPTVGTQNYSGLSVFSVAPVEGTIPPGKSQDVTVTFRPDHESLHYSDRLTVELTNKQTVCAFDLKGAACLHTMFLCGGDPLGVPVESLATLPPIGDPEVAEAEKPPLAVLLTLRSVYGESGVLPAVRELEVGCIRCSLPTAKKNVEFSWDGLPPLQERGFTVEPARGAVEPGTRRSITVTWAPPSGFSPQEVVRASARLTLRGDETEVYSVTLLAALANDQPREQREQREQPAQRSLTGEKPETISPAQANV
ncbi:cilia- and flagella-associated protein 74 isoform X2 [Anguilla rostrata]|uniref:cilia- and flagella-associated protein 74 isoform X2 n=1 Tax=Anguilla rostrata TaxID=7938 RepID=UPI0030CCF8C3